MFQTGWAEVARRVWGKVRKPMDQGRFHNSLVRVANPGPRHGRFKDHVGVARDFDLSNVGFRRFGGGFKGAVDNDQSFYLLNNAEGEFADEIRTEYFNEPELELTGE